MLRGGLESIYAPISSKIIAFDVQPSASPLPLFEGNAIGVYCVPVQTLKDPPPNAIDATNYQEMPSRYPSLDAAIGEIQPSHG